MTASRRFVPGIRASIHPRGEQYLKDVLCDIANTLGCETPEQGATKLEEIYAKLELDVPTASEEQFEELKISVNPVRLGNHPIALDVETIDMLYRKILNASKQFCYNNGRKF